MLSHQYNHYDLEQVATQLTVEIDELEAIEELRANFHLRQVKIEVQLEEARSKL